MKRIWAAIVIFGVVVGLSVWGLVQAFVTASGMLTQLTQIEAAVEQEDFDSAVKITEQAASAWEGQSRLFCAFCNHVQIETADKELDALQVYLDAKDRNRALEHCGQLRIFWKHLQTVDLPYLENIL